MDLIIDLGGALYKDYGNKMTEWSGWEFAVAGDDLFPSFGGVQDIIQLEEGWQAFATIFQNLQTDYFPQDLLIFSCGTSLPPEQQPESQIRKERLKTFLLQLLPKLATSGTRTSPTRCILVRKTKRQIRQIFPPQTAPRNSCIDTRWGTA